MEMTGKKEDSTYRKAGKTMKFQQIRNATTKIEYGGLTFLIDPWLAEKGALGSFRSLSVPDFEPPLPEQWYIPMPMCGLPMAPADILAHVDAYILTHVHPDHIDMSPDGVLGAPLDHSTPLWVQGEADRAAMVQSGFADVRVLSAEGTKTGPVKMIKIEGRHGTITPCGPSCGIVFQAEGEPTIYAAGDTIWYDGVEQALAAYKPDIIIVNACAAHLTKYGRLIMDADDVEKVCQACPDATVIASHMDTVSHASLTRQSLRLVLDAKGLQDVYIPADGETYDL